MRTLLVTGGAGFIGSNFIRHMLIAHADVRVVNLDKLTYAGNLSNLKDIEDDPRYTFVRGDISDRSLVNRLLRDEDVHSILNFAAESHVDRSVLDASPFVTTNIGGTLALLDAAREHGVHRFVQISTDEVYGSLDSEGVFHEESPISPNNPYAATKAAAELLCRAYYRTYGVPVIITRSSNNYGPYQFPEKLIPLMIRNALGGKPLPIYGEGKQVRDWLHVKDNCLAIDLVRERGEGGSVYNIGGSCEKENIEVVERICSILESTMVKEVAASSDHLSPHDLIEFIDDPRGAAHDFRYALDSSRIRESLGWSPTIGFADGLKSTVAWYRTHREWTENVISGEYQEYYEKVYG